MLSFIPQISLNVHGNQRFDICCLSIHALQLSSLNSALGCKVPFFPHSFGQHRLFPWSRIQAEPPPERPVPGAGSERTPGVPRHPHLCWIRGASTAWNPTRHKGQSSPPKESSNRAKSTSKHAPSALLPPLFIRNNECGH